MGSRFRKREVGRRKSAAPRPKGNGIRRLRALLLGLAIAFLLAVGVLRVGAGGGTPSIFRSTAVPGLIYEGKPGVSTIQGAGTSLPPWPVTLDEFGGRTTPDGDPGCGSIWVLGDSFAFGWGVADDQAWPSRLGPLLRSRQGCSPKVNNWALPGYHLGQMEARLLLLSQQAKPELVVLHIEEFDGFPDFDFANPLGLPERLLSSSLFRPFQVLAVLRFDRSVVENPDRRREQDRRLAERVTSIAGTLRAKDIDSLVVVEPEVSAATREVIRRDLGVPLDLAVCNRPGDRLATDPHYSDAGNRCIAGQVVERVLEQFERPRSDDSAM